MKTKNIILACVSVVFAFLVVGGLFYFSGHNADKTFLVFEDNLGNQVDDIFVDVVSPIDREDVCDIAKKACGASLCLDVKTLVEKIKEAPDLEIDIYKKTYGDFDYIVKLNPVCGDTLAYVNEKDNEVVCFCSYE